MAMERFDSMMRITVSNRWIRGFQIGGMNGEDMEINHLLYADDKIISVRQSLSSYVTLE